MVSRNRMSATNPTVAPVADKADRSDGDARRRSIPSSPVRDPSAEAGPTEPAVEAPSPNGVADRPARGRGGMVRFGEAHRLGLQALAVFLLFLLISVLLWGLPLLPHLATTLAYQRRHGYATNNDVRLFAWSLTWWPHAIGHASNPFHSTLLWAPQCPDVS